MFNKDFLETIKQALDPKSNVFAFMNGQKDINANDINSLANGELQTTSDERRLEAMVRQQLKEEFPNIEKSSSYDLLVDAVIHNYKSKQLQATDDAQIK